MQMIIFIIIDKKEFTLFFYEIFMSSSLFTDTEARKYFAE